MYDQSRHYFSGMGRRDLPEEKFYGTALIKIRSQRKAVVTYCKEISRWFFSVLLRTLTNISQRGQERENFL